MKISKGYNIWASTYDEVENKTRDLEEIAARSTLANYIYHNVIELGCGTGKNTEWLKAKADSIIALDFSEEMLELARSKISSKIVQFKYADINRKWEIENEFADLISCSLTLEHISNLDFIFSEAYRKLKANGIFYICELHPFKQYTGSKARFENKSELIELEVFTHNTSDYIDAAVKEGFKMIELKEWFDNNDKTEIPRLISFVFEK